MKFAFIHTKRHQYPIRRMCAVLGVSPSGYYAWRKRPPSNREQANEKLLEKIKAIYHRNRSVYGSPRIHKELQEQGISCGRHRVARLMRAADIRARRQGKKVRTTQRDPHRPVAPNLIKRNFQASAPNQKWLSDITYIATKEGWLYLAAILDLFSRKIVGWAMDASMTSDLVTRAMRMAIDRRKPSSSLIHHSDQGRQYASADFQELLKKNNIQCSMSSIGNCYDNAPMESFFGTLKGEWVYFQDYLTRSQARNDIFDYIEVFYNRQRRHSAINYQSPEIFENAF